MTFFIPRCPFVGPLFGMEHAEGGWDISDVPDHGDGAWSDKEFAREYNERDPEKVMKEPPVH